MHNNLIILAGGASSRMKKETLHTKLSQEEITQANERSKGLIGVDTKGRPFLDYLLCNAKNAGYSNIFIVIGEDCNLFKTFYGNLNQGNLFNDLIISYAIQKIPKDRTKPFGTADALCQALEQYPQLKKQQFSVCNSDNLYSTNALLALRETKSPNAFIGYDRAALQFNSERISKFAIAKVSSENQLLDIIEKPNADLLECYKDQNGAVRVSMNAFKFDGNLLYNHLKNCPIHPERAEKELPTALLNTVKEFPNTTQCIPFSEHVPDLTAKEDILDVKSYLQANSLTLTWE